MIFPISIFASARGRAGLRILNLLGGNAVVRRRRPVPRLRNHPDADATRAEPKTSPYCPFEKDEGVGAFRWNKQAQKLCPGLNYAAFRSLYGLIRSSGGIFHALWIR